MHRCQPVVTSRWIRRQCPERIQKGLGEVEAGDAAAARAVVERLASELLSNPLIEAYAVEELEGARV